MKFKQEDILLDRVKEQMSKHLEPQSIAVFDADGTLWLEDVNHLLLHHQEKYHLRKHSDLLDERYKMQDRSLRCKEFARRQEGFSLEELKSQIHQVLEENPLQVFSFQNKLLHFLKEKNIFIYVVTASLTWLVEQTIEKYRLPVDKVLGVATHVENGKITSKLIEPLTYGLGKQEALLLATNQKKPLLAAGNSPSDLSLLEIAKISLVVSSADAKNENYSFEQEMKSHVEKNNWILFET